MYKELPQIIMVDEGTEYMGTFAELYEMYDMKLDMSDVQAHNALRVR